MILGFFDILIRVAKKGSWFVFLNMKNSDADAWGNAESNRGATQ